MQCHQIIYTATCCGPVSPRSSKEAWVSSISVSGTYRAESNSLSSWDRLQGVTAVDDVLLKGPQRSMYGTTTLLGESFLVTSSQLAGSISLIIQLYLLCVLNFSSNFLRNGVARTVATKRQNLLNLCKLSDAHPEYFLLDTYFLFLVGHLNLFQSLVPVPTSPK